MCICIGGYSDLLTIQIFIFAAVPVVLLAEHSCTGVLLTVLALVFAGSVHALMICNQVQPMCW